MDSRVEKLINSIGRLREYVHTQEMLLDVKNCLNEIFMPDASCKEFIYTLNTDKLPFGCIVFPEIKGHEIVNLFCGGEWTRFSEYRIEIDSKMFDYGLSDEEVACIMLYNIYHMVADTTPMDRCREMIDAYLTNTDTSIVIRNTVHYQAILQFGCVDALNQLTSCLYLPDEVRSDPFLESLGLDCFDVALDKIYKEIPDCENEVTRLPKLTMLQWALRLYRNVEEERIPAIHVMKRAKELTASHLYDRKMDAVIEAMNRIDTDTYISESVQDVFNESSRRGGLLAQLKYNGLRSIEEDLYEFKVRAKNAETEEEVMYALKQINSRLAILDDYIISYPDDPDIDRWRNVSLEYRAIRDEMAKKKIYNKKRYGIYIDYNKLDELDNEDD